MSNPRIFVKFNLQDKLLQGPFQLTKLCHTFNYEPNCEGYTEEGERHLIQKIENVIHHVFPRSVTQAQRQRMIQKLQPSNGPPDVMIRSEQGDVYSFATLPSYFGECLDREEDCKRIVFHLDFCGDIDLLQPENDPLPIDVTVKSNDLPKVSLSVSSSNPEQDPQIQQEQDQNSELIKKLFQDKQNHKQQEKAKQHQLSESEIYVEPKVEDPLASSSALPYTSTSTLESTTIWAPSPLPAETPTANIISLKHVCVPSTQNSSVRPGQEDPWTPSLAISRTKETTTSEKTSQSTLTKIQWSEKPTDTSFKSNAWSSRDNENIPVGTILDGEAFNVTPDGMYFMLKNGVEACVPARWSNKLMKRYEQNNPFIIPLMIWTAYPGKTPVVTPDVPNTSIHSLRKHDIMEATVVYIGNDKKCFVDIGCGWNALLSPEYCYLMDQPYHPRKGDKLKVEILNFVRNVKEFPKCQIRVALESVSDQNDPNEHGQESLDLARGDVIRGYVKEIKRNLAKVDINYKYDGVLKRHDVPQCEDMRDILHIGDEINLVVYSKYRFHDKFFVECIPSGDLKRRYHETEFYSGSKRYKAEYRQH